MTRLFKFDLNTDLQHRWRRLDGWRQVGDYMSFHSTPGSHSASGIEIPLPLGLQEAWLTYRIWFEPPRFPFGSDMMAWAVTGKMPGLGSRGNATSAAVGHTGRVHDDQGWSGRMNWRGHRRDGQSSLPADGTVLGLYAYDLAVARVPGSAGRHIPLKNDPASVVNPVQGGVGSGTGPGNVGDRNGWFIPQGEWITLTMGYGVGDEHWFECWASTESQPNPIRRLRIDGPDFRWTAHDARQEIDTFLFQTHWGGGTPEWQPTRRAEIRFSNVEVHDSNPLILPQPPITTPEPVTVSEPTPTGPVAVSVMAKGTTGSEQLELWVNGNLEVEWVAMQDYTQVSAPNLFDVPIESLEVRFVNDGEEFGSDRNAQVLGVKVGNVSIPSSSAMILRDIDGAFFGGGDGRMYWNSRMVFTGVIPQHAITPSEEVPVESDSEPEIPPSAPDSQPDEAAPNHVEQLPDGAEPLNSWGQTIESMSREARVELIHVLTESLL